MKKAVPKSYVCYRCMEPGHYIQDCHQCWQELQTQARWHSCLYDGQSRSDYTTHDCSYCDLNHINYQFYNFSWEFRWSSNTDEE
jgi:hypothetical protein